MFQFVLIFQFLYFIPDKTESDVYEKLLYNSAQTYYKEIRPQRSNDAKKPLSVKFDLHIQNIHSLVTFFMSETLFKKQIHILINKIVKVS